MQTVASPATRAAIAAFALGAAAYALTSCSSASTPAASPSTSSGSPSASATGTQSTGPTPDADAVDVSILASDTACNVVPVRVPAGKLVFTVSNTGDKVNGFALYEGANGQTLLAESRNIASGGTGGFNITLKAGEYSTVCKPGETGNGIRGKFTVAGG